AFSGMGGRDVMDGAGRPPCILTIFFAKPLIDSRRSVAHHFRDIGKRFGCALESLGDEGACLVACLADELFTTAAEAIGKSALRATGGRQRAVDTSFRF